MPFIGACVPATPPKFLYPDMEPVITKSLIKLVGVINPARIPAGWYEPDELWLISAFSMVKSKIVLFILSAASITANSPA